MAKGFKVKTVAPKVKAPEWDIDAIKARMKGKTIVFCLPGRGCSYIFLEELCAAMFRHGSEWNEYTNITRLLFYGKLCKM